MKKSASSGRAPKTAKDAWGSFMVAQLAANRPTPTAAPKPARVTAKRKPVNERGRPINEGHHFSKLADEHIAAILELNDLGVGYAEISRRFVGTLTVTPAHVRLICLGLRRSQLSAT
jgi:hypothetical protein